MLKSTMIKLSRWCYLSVKLRPWIPLVYICVHVYQWSTHMIILAVLIWFSSSILRSPYCQKRLVFKVMKMPKESVLIKSDWFLGPCFVTPLNCPVYTCKIFSAFFCLCDCICKIQKREQILINKNNNIEMLLF